MDTYICTHKKFAYIRFCPVLAYFAVALGYSLCNQLLQVSVVATLHISTTYVYRTIVAGQQLSMRQVKIAGHVAFATTLNGNWLTLQRLWISSIKPITGHYYNTATGAINSLQSLRILYTIFFF